MFVKRGQSDVCFALFQLQDILWHLPQSYLGSILPPEVAESCLGAMCLLLPEVDHSQSLPPVLPLVPLVLVVNVLGSWVQLCLAAPIKGLRLKCQ